MRALMWICTLLVALWSGYWYVGKAAFERGAEGFFQQVSAEGFTAENAALSVAGYPNRFDLTVTEPRLGDPRRGLEWAGPFIQILTLSYKPWHVIAAFPPSQTIITPFEEITVTSDKLQASIVVSPNTNLTLDRTALVGNGLAFLSNRSWSVRAEELRLATRLDPSQSNTHEIGLEVQGLTPDRAMSELLPDLPATLDRIHLDAFATFSAPLDRYSGEHRPALTALSIKEGLINWGTMTVFAQGQLESVQGYAEGRLTIRVKGWRTLLPLAVATGMINPEVAPTAERMLEALATSTGDPDTLDVPLTFANGRMSLGPLPLGPAPRLN